jgi:hypothetical protein
MLFFGALLHLYGPQNKWGDLCRCSTDKEDQEFIEQQKEEYE